MIKLTMLAMRQPHLSSEEFDVHWRDRHAPLVRSHAAILGIRRYTQVSTLSDPAAQDRLRSSRQASPFPFDGYGELWWDNVEAMFAARETPEGRKALGALLEDETRFIDHGRCLLWFGQERVILPG